MSFNAYRPLPDSSVEAVLEPEWVQKTRQIVSECEFRQYTFNVKIDGRGGVYLQAAYFEPDATTGEMSIQYTRRWFLSPAMPKSEIVQTVFKCVMTSYEHQVREWFAWKKKPIFHPHYDVDALYAICERREER